MATNTGTSNWANAFYSNPRLTAMLVLMVAALGATAYGTLARQEDPTLTERFGFIATFLPGATAERVEALVSEPIETALREIPEIKELKSKSRAGYSLIDIDLYDNVPADRVDVHWAEIRDKLSEVYATLPAGTVEPELTVASPIAATIIAAFRWSDDTQPQFALLSRLARSLEVALANQPGTKEVEVYGEVDEELLVTVDPYRLAAAGMTAADVSAAIAATDTKLAAGRLHHSSADLLVEVGAELSSIERIARIPLKESLDNGSVLRVSDVSEVRKFRRDPPQTMALIGNERTVFVAAKMEPGQIIDNWLAGANQTLTKVRDQLPAGIELDVVYNQNDYTGKRIAELIDNLVLALGIVVGTLVFFMGLRSALIVGLALPLSGAMVLAGMSFMNIPLHQMSVTGLIISLGLLIDNAIVVVEDYQLKRGRGQNIAEAIAGSVRHLLVPLGASTATTICAFMPIALAPGGTGDFTGTIGLNVSLAVFSSFILAMTVVPAITGMLDNRFGMQRASERWWQSGYSNANLTRGYRASVLALVKRPALGIAAGCVLPIIGFGLAGTLTQQFFPPVDRNQFQLQIALPVQASLAETRAAVAVANDVLDEFEIGDRFWTLGEGAPRTYYNVVVQADGIASFAAGWATTKSAAHTREVLPKLQQALSAALPQAEVLALPFEQGPPFDAPIEVRIIGPEFGELRRLGEELRLLLSGIDAVTYTRATLSVTEPKLVFEPDESALAAVGFRTGELPQLLAASLDGLPGGTVQEGNTQLDVRVRLPDAYRDGVDALASLPLPTNGGGTVPLEQLGRWNLEPTPQSIDRYQGERVATVQGFLTPFTLPAGVLNEFQARFDAAGIQLPAGYRINLGGEAEQRASSLGNLISVFVLFAVAMMAIVVLSLNSFRQAGVIGLVAVLSMGLALFGVRLFSWPLGFTAIIGMLGMIGLAINGSIIVLSALKVDPRALHEGAEGVADTVVDATRHIISTTATTIGGFVPLIVFGGTFWPPLATAIAGGVAGSAILALYTVPAFFHLALRHGLDRGPMVTLEGDVEQTGGHTSPEPRRTSARLTPLPASRIPDSGMPSMADSA
ncbi:MAG: efflux RND transporter permease subunit [Pseudomonadota bacterium]